MLATAGWLAANSPVTTALAQTTLRLSHRLTGRSKGPYSPRLQGLPEKVGILPLDLRGSSEVFGESSPSLSEGPGPSPSAKIKNKFKK